MLSLFQAKLRSIRSAASAALLSSGLSPDRSYGAHPDGKPNKRRFFINITPGSENDPTSPEVNVFINEWLADNLTTNADPADGQFEDWFELYNAGPEAVDLSGFYLTDDLLTPTMFEIPAGTLIPAGARCTPGRFTRPETENERRPLRPRRPCATNHSGPRSRISRTQYNVSMLCSSVG